MLPLQQLFHRCRCLKALVDLINPQRDCWSAGARQLRLAADDALSASTGGNWVWK
jgi:hypothetical protein